MTVKKPLRKTNDSFKTNIKKQPLIFIIITQNHNEKKYEELLF